MMTMKIGDLSWQYSVMGAGATLVFIHGLGNDSKSWSPLADELSLRYRIVAVDLPGYSATGADQRTPSIDELTAGLAELLDLLKIESYSVIGHSFGGAVAAHLVSAGPTQVRTLVLLAPGGLGTEISPVLSLLGSRMGGTLLSFAYRPSTKRVVEYLANQYREIDSTLERDAKRPNITEFMETYNHLALPSARSKLHRGLRSAIHSNTSLRRDWVLAACAETPTLIIWGSDDRIVPPWHAEQVKILMPRARLETITGAGHAPHRSHVRQTLEIMSAFLEAANPDAAGD